MPDAMLHVCGRSCVITSREELGCCGRNSVLAVTVMMNRQMKKLNPMAMFPSVFHQSHFCPIEEKPCGSWQLQMEHTGSLAAALLKFVMSLNLIG